MEFSAEEIEEFRIEAMELLDEAESNLLSLEKGGNFRDLYSSVFRVFHSLKGGAGMLQFIDLQNHLHRLESHFQDCENLTELKGPQLNYFLLGVDASKKILNGNKITFDYSDFESSRKESEISAQVAPIQLSENSISSNSSQSNVLLYTAEDTKVFIIDDEPQLIEVVKQILDESGFQTFPFNNSIEAIGKIREIRPDAILTDINMPNLSGLEILKEVARIDPNLPVIYLSAHISKELMLESLSYGVFAALEKPFKSGDIIATCKNATERHKLIKLLNSTINFLYFQYSDLDLFMQSKGNKSVRELFQTQFRELMEAKRRLKFLRRTAHQH